MTELSGSSWWVITVFIIGVLASIYIVVTGFSSLGRRPKRIWAHRVPPVDSDEFLLTVSGTINAPLQSGGTTEVLNNGDAFFPRILADFRDARHNINFSAYIWEPGKCSEMFFDVLTERAEAGVEVRILLDAFGGFLIPRKRLKQLRAAGAKVRRFRPLSIGQLSRFYKRNHRRAVVIDGRIGYTGGAAVGDKWLGDARNDKEWRDMMVRID